jgi:hypothetical protein
VVTPRASVQFACRSDERPRLVLSQVVPVLDVPGSIVVELFRSGGDAEVGRPLAKEVAAFNLVKLFGVFGSLRSRFLHPACQASAPVRQKERVEEGRIFGPS